MNNLLNGLLMSVLFGLHDLVHGEVMKQPGRFHRMLPLQSFKLHVHVHVLSVGPIVFRGKI